MLKLSREEKIDFILYQDIITATGYIYVRKKDIPNFIAYDESKLNALATIAIREMVADGGTKYATLDRDTILNYLIEVKGVASHRFETKSAKGLSLNTDEVLKPLYNRGIATNFLEIYMDYTSLKSVVSRMNKVVSRLVNEGEIDRNGEPIYRLGYSVSQKDNFRYNYKGEDIISIPKDYTRSYTVPDGYFLVWGDLKQSDFRIACNLMIIDETNYHYFEGSDDWYESIYRLLCDFYHRPFDHDEFTKRRPILKENILATVYGASSGDSDEATEFIKEFAQYLKTCKRYMEFSDRIDKYLDYKVPITIDTYFGNKVYVPSDMNRVDTKNKALNSPFQSGTSEVAIKIVMALIGKFRSLGYGEDDIRSYVIRHDEPVFMVSEKCIKDAWIFEECKEIFVDSWRSLGLDFTFGYSYLVEDDELTNKIKNSISENINKVSIEMPDKDFVAYMPLRKLYKLSIGHAYINETDVLVSILNMETYTARHFILKSDRQELDFKMVEFAPWKAILKMLHDEKDKALAKGIDEIIVLSQNDFGYEFMGELGVHVIVDEIEGSYANILSECRTYAYCNNKGIPYLGDTSTVSANSDFAAKVRTVDNFW